MKHLLNAIVLFLLGTSCFGSEAIQSAFDSLVYLQQDVIRKASVNGQEYELWLKHPRKPEFQPYLQKHAGTGYFIVVGKDHPYLVTAHHVAKKMTPNAIAVICDTNDTPFPIRLADLAGSRSLSWISHSEADVAVLPIRTKQIAVLRKLEKHFLPHTVLMNELKPPTRDLELTVLGFPLNLGIKGKFSPISSSSKPASGLLTIGRFDTKKPTTFFLLQDPSVGGFSGAPVLDLPGTKFQQRGIVFKKGIRCYGVMHGTISDDTGGKFAAVTPSKFVRETLDLADSKWPLTSIDKKGQHEDSNRPR